MIWFKDWVLETDGQVIAQQFDHLTRTLIVVGDVPEDWDWTMLVQVGDAMDLLPLTRMQDGVGIVLAGGQLSFAGYYTMQLRAVRGELVRHTNTIHVYIPASLTGDRQWPTVPSAFSDLERRTNEAAQKAEQAASRAESHTAHPPVVGENDNWWSWDGTGYVDTGKPSRGELTCAQGNVLYAGALKGTASGATVRLDDISPLEHTVPVKVNGADENTVVKAQGKNLFDYKAWVEWSKAVGGNGKETATYLGEECFSYLLWRESGTQFFTDIEFKENTQYTFTLEWSLSDSSGASPNIVPFLIYYTDGTYTGAAPYHSDQTKFRKTTVVSDAGKTVSYLSVNRYSKACTIYVKKNMQIEVGTTSTAYEPYMEPVSYPVQTVYGENIFDASALGKQEIWELTKYNGEDAVYLAPLQDAVLPFSFEPNTQYVFNFDVACPEMVSNNYFDYAQTAVFLVEVEHDESYEEYWVGLPTGPYDEFQTFKWVSPPNMSITRVSAITYDNAFVDEEGVGVASVGVLFKTNMTIRPVSAECEVPSIYPTMTLTTDTAGAVMDCEYNRDINKAFEQLTQAIISMGGNI